MSTVIDGSLGITYPDSSNQPAAASPYTLKNRIINGSMQIDQRNAGASVTPTAAAYTLDRWRATVGASSKFSVQQVSDAPTGFVNSLKITSLAATTVGTTDYYEMVQRIEGYNISDLGWGAAGASTVTLSFWVKSSLTGTFGGALNNNGYTRSYPFTYTISAANTWEYKTVTIAGDTTGTWAKDNNTGINLGFSMGVGATYSGTAGVWAGTDYENATGSVNLVSTNGATWYITGVQLEIGTSATPFERRLYGQELANCQRYYQRFNATNENGNYTLFGWGHAYGTGTINIGVQLFVPMRTYPSSLDTSAMSTFQYETGTSAGNTPTSIAINANSNSNWMAQLDVSKSASFTNAASYKLQAYNTKTTYLGFGAEL